MEVGEEVVDEFVEAMLVLLRDEVLLLGKLNHPIHCLAELRALHANTAAVLNCCMLAVLFRRRRELFCMAVALEEGKNDCG